MNKWLTNKPHGQRKGIIIKSWMLKIKYQRRQTAQRSTNQIFLNNKWATQLEVKMD